MEEMQNKEKNIADVEELRNYLQNGYLLHGSKSPIEIIEPRQSSDTDPERTTGKAHAVYAEAHDIRIPILMALFAELDPAPKSWSSSYHGHGPDSPIEVHGENYTFTPGYIHVLPPDSFEKEGDDDDFEYISRSPVIPIKVIPIDPTILSEFPDIHIF